MPADVQESDWFYPAVKLVLGKGAMKGTDLGFEPNKELTIASIYQTLYNMEGSPAVAAGAGVSYTFTPADVALGTSDDRAVIPEGTTYANGYMKTTGKVVQRWHDGRGEVFCVEVDKDQKGAIEFTVASTADAVVSVSSTGGSNTSSCGIVDASDKAVKEDSGLTTVTGAQTGRTFFTYTNLAAGSYKIVSPADDNNRGARVYSITVE